MGRTTVRLAGRVAMVIGAFAATAGVAEAAYTVKEASFTMTYESDYRSVKDSVYARASTNCNSLTGTVRRDERSTSKATYRVKGTQAFLSQRRVSYGFTPVGRYNPLRPLPLVVRFKAAESGTLQQQVYDDVNDTCLTRNVPPGEPKRCNVPGKLNPQQDGDRWLAVFRRRDYRACEPDGYPGRTNRLRPYARISPGLVFSRTRNVIVGQARRTFPETDEDGARVTETATAYWKLTLVRTSPWRTRRVG